MKALFTPTPAKEKAIVIFSLLSMVFWIYPKAVLASVLQAPGQTTAQIFEIKITDASLLNPNSNNNQTFLTYNTTQQTDPLFTNLQAYLKDHNSPLQGYTSQLLEHDNWKMVLAISQVESNMCVHNLRYNCSGIGGPGHFYAFDNFGGWIDLHEQPFNHPLRWGNLRPNERHLRPAKKPQLGLWLQKNPGRTY